MKHVDILIVDDSPADRASMRIAFERGAHPVLVHFAESGRAALKRLAPSGEDKPRLRPHIMLVDIKMPSMSGLDLLALMKMDPALSEIPVIMLSGSDDQRDIRQAYAGFASGYIRKPLDMRDLTEIADVIGRLVTRVLAFPERSRRAIDIRTKSATKSTPPTASARSAAPGRSSRAPMAARRWRGRA